MHADWPLAAADSQPQVHHSTNHNSFSGNASQTSVDLASLVERVQSHCVHQWSLDALAVGYNGEGLMLITCGWTDCCDD